MWEIQLSPQNNDSIVLLVEMEWLQGDKHSHVIFTVESVKFLG
jgi:hypothetical protein